MASKGGSTAAAGPRVLLIDNYDSFTWNVYQFLYQAGAAKVTVYRNDQVTIEECEAYAPTHVVISPGPGRPADAAISNQVIQRFAGRVPVLGVCLGEQCMFELYGGTVTYAGEIKHGKTSPISHDGCGVFTDLPQGLEVIRYHSLAGDIRTLPPCLVVTAQTANGIVMGVRHTSLVVEGVQFHPESIKTEHGLQMIQTFLSWTAARWADMGGVPGTRPVVVTNAPTPVGPPASGDILETIMAQRRLDVARAEKELPLASLVAKLALAPPVVNFEQRLRAASVHTGPSADGGDAPWAVSVIGEVKRASPSKGDIAPNADAAAVAATYARAGVAAVSVLTEPTWFKGSLDDLAAARRAVEAATSPQTRPALLRKDFIFCDYQVLEARAAGADTVLLIVACLADDELVRLIGLSRTLGMEPLVEVNSSDEMQRALGVGARVIGVNNRHLRTFTVDMDTTTRLASQIPRDGSVLLAALSGISSRRDVETYKDAGIAAVLVGEALMRTERPDAFIRHLALGESL